LSSTSTGKKYRYFGTSVTNRFIVFSGHGGAKVARYAAIHLHRHIVKRPEYKKGDIAAAIREGFLECDRAMREDADLRDEMAGATAVTVLMRGGRLWCGNAGDSRCIASVGGRAQALSTDHKPNDPAERERIEAAGGFVEFNRVNGNLALSRALGDFLFKMNDGLSQVGFTHSYRYLT
jgi:protein phosphatase PTC2/3